MLYTSPDTNTIICTKKSTNKNISPSLRFSFSQSKHKPSIKPSFSVPQEKVMNRAKLLRLSIGLGNSLSSTRQLALPLLSFTQVNRFSHLTQSPPFYPHLNPQTSYKYLNLHLNLFFSSKPESFIDLILSSNDWSGDIEKELEKLNPKLTHESVVYVLVKLNKNPQKALDFFKWVCAKKGFNPSYVPYARLLTYLACKDFESNFWEVAHEMKEKGFYFDKDIYLNVAGNLKRGNLIAVAKKWTEFYNTVCAIHDVNAVGKYAVDLILESEWSEVVESKLKKKLKFPVSESFLLRVFRELGKQPLRALKFFDWVGSCGGYSHNGATYNAMVRVLARPDSIDEFWDFVERMRSEGYEVDMDTYFKITRHAYLPAEDDVKLFELMMDGPYKPSAECHLILKRISLDYDTMDLVHRVINKYLDAGFTLTKNIYDGMHRILSKTGRFDEAKKIIEEMRGAGYVPDNITYSQEVFGLCKEERFDEALKVLDQMEAEGCVPDIMTWTILLQGYCTANQVDEALACFARMIEKNITPDADTIKVLLYGFLSQNKLLGAYKFLVEMVDKVRVKPWQATYKHMIEKLAEDGRIDEAFDLFRLMSRHGYPPFADPIIRYISRSGTTNDAKNFLNLVSAKDSSATTPYVRVIRSFFEAGRESEARDLLYSSPYGVRRRKELRKMFGSDQPSQPEQIASRQR